MILLRRAGILDLTSALIDFAETAALVSGLDLGGGRRIASSLVLASSLGQSIRSRVATPGRRVVGTTTIALTTHCSDENLEPIVNVKQKQAFV